MAGGDGDANVLIRIAVFSITMSIIATCMITWYASGSSDYDYDTINAYRSDLTEFSGGQLVNDTPWILTDVYTPFVPGQVAESDIPNHIDTDGGRLSTGWLFGSRISDYPDLNKSADIHLDKEQKSNQLLTTGATVNYEFENGKEWWNGGNDYGIIVIDPTIVEFFGNLWNQDTSHTGYVYESGSANNWNYTGYRYVFDPTLPFSNGESAKDGRLSIVWYNIPSDTGLSGALEIYGGNGSEQILLGRYSASDIVSAFQSTSGYVRVFDFDFNGVTLNLTIRFNPTVFNTYSSLMQAWNDGAWSMSISSASAGNFFDVENSNAFSATAGSMLDTFIDIYTFDYPKFGEPWMDVILWLLVGLPMTMGLLMLTARLVGGVFRIF